MTPENIEFVSEEKALVSMDYEIYVDLNKKQYFVQEGTGYVLNDSETYYEVQTMDDVFANGKKADIHIIKSDEYQVPVIKYYVYKNTFSYFNFFKCKRFKILVLPENWGIEAN